uniref:ARAD1D05610p n=1 Tax=Blastobotrys adeninivorans TaxID=409370 RepID=A0A060T8U8_BLAAD
MDAYALETEAQALTFPDDKRQKRFELGVCMAMYNWEDLTLAVENQWAGSESSDIRDWMVGAIVELFEDNYTDAGEIETRLLQMMQDEFDVDVQDGSGEVVAQQIVNIYRQCAEENFSTVEKLFSQYQEREEKKSKGLLKPQIVKPQTEAGEDDDSEEEGEWEDDDAQNSSGPSQTPTNEAAGPIVDDDGFELVQKKNRRGR